jgi:hypothetical protein
VGFIIGSDVIGSAADVCYNIESKEFSKPDPKISWTYTTKSTELFCINELFRLNKIKISTEPPQKYRNALRSIGINSTGIPWRYVMPIDAYKSYCYRIASDISKHFEKLDKDYYADTFKPSGEVLNHLKRACIDKKKYLEHARTEGSPAALSVLESFEPLEDGFCSKVKYDRYSSKTGRLTVKSGPNIMILKKGYRNILKSSFKDGKIVQLDYSSFEARLALGLAGKKTNLNDVYTYISDSLFGGTVKRDACKTMVLGVLFGMGTEAMANLAGIDKETARSSKKKIKDYFKFNQAVQPLIESAESNGSIHNFYGRKIMADSLLPGKLFNLLVQSTGVDASLLGFSSFVRAAIEKQIEIRPLFVLHDALIIDCPDSSVHRIDEAIKCAEVIKGFEINFPIKKTIL